MGIFGFFKGDKPEKRLAIIDVNDDTFNQQVVRRSYKEPVVVDFWAAWCGPCRQLGPTLEKIAEDPKSEFILAKLNTEHNQKTAAQYGIRSIPNVKAFRNGQVVQEFTGALPEVLVRRFVSKVMSTPAPSPRLKISAVPSKRLKQGIRHLKKGRGFEAYVVLNDFPDSDESEHAEQLLPLAKFIYDIEDGDGVTGVDELDEAYGDALKALRKERPDEAITHLAAALKLGENIDANHTQRVIDSIIKLLGRDHPAVSNYLDRNKVT